MVAMRLFCGCMAVFMVIAAIGAFQDRVWPFLVYAVIVVPFGAYQAWTYRPYISPPGAKRWDSDEIGNHF